MLDMMPTWRNVVNYSNERRYDADLHLLQLLFSWGHHMKLTAVFQKVPEGYIALVEELPGANTQGDTLDEARENLTKAVALVLEANRLLTEESLRGKVVIREPLIFAGG